MELDEQTAVGRVYEVLRDRFPSVAPEVVEAVVRREHAALDGPLRTFIPVLVQRAAGNTLRDLCAPPSQERSA